MPGVEVCSFYIRPRIRCSCCFAMGKSRLANWFLILYSSNSEEHSFFFNGVFYKYLFRSSRYLFADYSPHYLQISAKTRYFSRICFPWKNKSGGSKYASSFPIRFQS